MECRIEKAEGNYQIQGLISFVTVCDLYKQGREVLEGLGEVKVNFDGVTQVDSSAIALLLSWLRVAKQKGKSILFVNLPSQVLEIASVCEVMPILKDHIITAIPAEE